MRFFHWKYEEFESAIYFNNCDYVTLDLDYKTEKYKIGEDKRTGKWNKRK